MRRRRSFRDPVGDLATREYRQLAVLLDRLPAEQTTLVKDFFGLEDRSPVPWMVLSRRYHITPDQLIERVKGVLEGLRASGVECLLVCEGDEVEEVIDVRRTTRHHSDPKLVRCGNYGCGNRLAPGFPSELWASIQNLEVTLEVTVQRGRPRKYCSNRCRQAAYRLRKTQRSAAGPM